MKGLFTLVSLLITVGIIGLIFVRVMGNGNETTEESGVPRSSGDMIDSISDAEKAKELIESRGVIVP